MSTPVIVPPEIVVAGGEKFEVTLRDRTSHEIVLIRLVPVRELSTYGALIEQPAELVEFVCGKAKGWADALDDDSLYALDERVRYWNDPRLDRLMERQIKAVAAAKPILEKASKLTNSSAM